MTRRSLLLLAGAVAGMAVIAGIAFGVFLRTAWPRLQFYRLTGAWSPVEIVETMDSPVPVQGWNESGLILADRRQIQLPGFVKLPVSSLALAEATKGGVDIGTNGRIHGLVRVHHWCGNDPVRKHIARVDLSDLLTFLGQGEKVTGSVVTEAVPGRSDRKFSPAGWRAGDYFAFRRFAEGSKTNQTVPPTGATGSTQRLQPTSSSTGSRR